MHGFGTRPAGMVKIRVALVLGCAIAFAGCYDIEQDIVLNRDLSGTASLRMRIDMEPMAYFVALMSREMAGGTGEPTAEELQVAKDRLLADQEQVGDFDPEKFKRAQSVSLPDGVRIRDVQFSRQGLQLSYAVDFEFDRFEDIVAIRMENTARADFNPDNPKTRPFGTLRLVDDGKTLLVTIEPINSMTEQQMDGPPPPGMEAAFAGAMAGLHFALRIDAPFEVVEDNAMAIEGNTLIWEYDSEALTAAQAPEPIRVRYRK